MMKALRSARPIRHTRTIANTRRSYVQIDHKALERKILAAMDSELRDFNEVELASRAEPDVSL